MGKTLEVMSGCLDRVECGCDCDRLEPVKEWLRPKRNMFASVISGTLVSTFWIKTSVRKFQVFVLLVCHRMVGGD